MSQQHVVGADQHWRGRLALRVEGPSTEAVNGVFELQGQAQKGQLSMSAPWGLKMFQAHWTPDEAVLALPHEQRHYPDMAALTEDAVGAALPVAALFHWLKGQAMPGAATSPTAEGFEQLGWQIDTREYAQGRLALLRLTPQPKVRVRIILAS